MGHRKTMVMLVITRGYIFFYFASKAMNLSTDQDWVARISHVVPERQEVAARRNGSCESIVSLRRCRAQIWKAVQWLRKNASWKVLQKLSQIDLTETSQFYFWHFQILLKESSESRSNKRISWDFSSFRVDSIRCWNESRASRFSGHPAMFVASMFISMTVSHLTDSNHIDIWYIYISYTSILGLYM